jgi:predicted nucleic acid-binding protein
VAVILAEAAEVIATSKRLRVFADEPENRILECAEAGEADCIVTGNKAMLKLGSYGDIRIISLQQYLAGSLS